MAKYSEDGSDDGSGRGGGGGDQSLSDYYNSFFGGSPDNQDIGNGGSTVTTQPVAAPVIDTSGTSNNSSLIARGDPNGNSTNATNPANNYTSAPAASSSPSYSDPGSMFMALIGAGGDANSIVNQINSQFGLSSPNSYAYYAPGAHGPGSGAVVGIPSQFGGGYYAAGPDGQWGYNAGDSGGGGAAAASSGLTPTGGTSFADPAYQQLMQMVQQRLGQLNQPVSFPQLDQYMSMLQANQAAAKQRAQTFADQLSTRVAQLQQPLLSDANVAQIRANASNNLLSQRDAQVAAARADLARRGFDPNSSGLAINQNNLIDQNYRGAQSNIDAQLQEQQIQGDEQRRNQATQLQGLIQQALQGGDVTALGEQAQVADLENQLFDINQNRAREALTTAQIPVDLTNQGFANAVNASNSTSNPLGLLLSLAAIGNQQQGLQQAGTNSNMSALAWLLQQALS